MQSRILRSTVLAAAVAFSSLAFAAGAPAQSTPAAAPAKPHAQSPRHSLLDELNLTDKQQSTIRETMQHDFQQLRPQIQSVTQKREAFEKATPGTAAYQSALKGLAQAEADFAKARTLRQGALRSKIYEELTPAQRTKLKSLVAEQKARVQQMREAAEARRAAGSSAPPASH